MADEKLPEPLSITLRNVKQHRELTVDLSGRMIVLVGPNGVGKTTLLKGLRAVGALDDQEAYDLKHWERIAKTFGRAPLDLSSTHRFLRGWCGHDGVGVIEVAFDAGRIHFEIGTDLRDSSLIVPGTSRLARTEPALFNQRTRDQHIRALRSVYLQPEYSALARPSRVEATTLGERGENLASVIAQFALRYPKQQQEVLAALRTIVPEVTFVGALTKMEVASEPAFQAYELEFEFNGGARLLGSAVSEGTLIALAVLSLAHHSAGVKYVLLDDIDRGLHPLAQKALVSQLRAVLAARPELKIICTSHSPYLVEHFEASEVRVLGRNKKTGDTVCKRLDQHPEWPKYKEYLDTGSYWASVGEDWVGES